MKGYTKEEGIKIVPYNPEWPVKANQEIQFLRGVLGDHLLIEHFGSTAVVGLSAKDIIDIQIFAESPKELERIKKILMPLYQGVSSEESQKKGFLVFDKCYEVNGETRRTHHIHVRDDQNQWERSLLFRDYLRANPKEIANYEACKKVAAELSPHDMTSYSKHKDDYIEKIVQLAKKEKSGNN